MDFVEARQTAARPMPAIEQDRTLRLPDVVNVPAFSSQGDSFTAGFRTYRYRGETIVKVGAVRKAAYVLWATDCAAPKCRLDAVTRIPQHGGVIPVKDLVTTCQGCRARTLD